MSLSNKLSVVILAAGEGTRMRSKAAKVLFPICGRPMVNYVLDAAVSLMPERIVVVVGHKGDEVIEAVQHTWKPDNLWAGKLEFAQREQKEPARGHVRGRQQAISPATRLYYTGIPSYYRQLKGFATTTSPKGPVYRLSRSNRVIWERTAAWSKFIGQCAHRRGQGYNGG